MTNARWGPRWGELRTPPELLPKPGARVDAAQRARIVDWAVTQYAARGWRVESRSDSQAVLARTEQVNHVAHLLVSLITCLVWLLGWLILVLRRRTERIVVWVDDWGQLRETAYRG